MVACVLVVEDERKIRDLLRSYLEHDGFSVLATGSGAEAIQLARESQPDLVLLDLGLPDVTGEDVAGEIHAFSDVPIVMLTAKAEVDDRVRGLRLGADDYISKPFSPREVVLRVRAVLRRSGAAQDAPVSFGRGRLVIDGATRTVTMDGLPAALTCSEWDLLTTLAGAPGHVFSRAELVNRIRGYEFDGYERIIDTHVKNLRRKLGTDTGEPHSIETVIGVGYRLVLPRDRVPAPPGPQLTRPDRPR